MFIFLPSLIVIVKRRLYNYCFSLLLGTVKPLYSGPPLKRESPYNGN